jgi:uncharacterized protein YndB with AHSA1/START domain
MAVVRRTQVIDRPVAEVFDVVADGANWAKWNPTVQASRRLDDGEIGNGSRFEWELRGVGKVVQEFHEFKENAQVRIVPDTKSVGGGHRFRFTTQGVATRVDHELELIPKGAFKLLTPMIVMVGRRNLRDTANALQRHLEP